MEENSVNTLLKFAVFKNGGKLEKTGYAGSVRTPSQPENHSTCPEAESASVRSPKTEKNYCTCLWAQAAQLTQLINHNRHVNCCTCPRAQRALQPKLQLELQLKQKLVKILKFAREKCERTCPERAQLLYLSKRQLLLLLSQQKYKRNSDIFGVLKAG